MTPHNEPLRVQYVLLNISNLDRYVYFFGYVAEPKVYPISPIKYYGNLSFPLSLPKIAFNLWTTFRYLQFLWMNIFQIR